MSKASVIEGISNNILIGDIEGARHQILKEYPFVQNDIEKRSYTVKQKMDQFTEDGFIDRYSGEKLVNPGMLKVLSVYFPEEFPYHPHWKTTETHAAYWELIPTIDHIQPIAIGGKDEASNWATTSMLNNSIKSNWTLEQIRWSLWSKGKIEDWNGLTYNFVEIVRADKNLLEDNYIKQWYNQSKDLHEKIQRYRRLISEFEKPPIEKSDIEKKYDEKCREYRKYFDEGYGVYIGQGHPTMEEMIVDIEECIKSGRKSTKSWMTPMPKEYIGTKWT